MNSASTGSTAPFMVIETDICDRSMPSNSVRMSKMESIATPAMPTSPRTRGWSRIVAAVRREIEGDREALLAGGDVAAVEGVAESSAVEKPAYWRMVQGCVTYMVG